MTKFQKISAIALFSVFLAACEKPVEKAAQAPQTETPAAQVENKVESKAEEKAAQAVDTGAEDYKTFREWQKAQERAIEIAITTEVEKLGEKAKDEKLLREAMNKALLAQADVIKQSADALKITDAQVNQLKEKSLEALTLGTQLMSEGEKVAQQPSEDAHKAFSELQAKLDKVAQEGRELEAQLIKKYEPVEKNDAKSEATEEKK